MTAVRLLPERVRVETKGPLGALLAADLRLTAESGSLAVLILGGWLMKGSGRLRLHASVVRRLLGKIEGTRAVPGLTLTRALLGAGWLGIEGE